MTTSYKQLTQPERYQIEALCKLDYSARSVALQLGRSNKTISNELSRFEGLIYCAQTAHQQSAQRSSTAKKTNNCHDEVNLLTRSFLLTGLSPEQISGRMGNENYPHKVSLTTIYTRDH